MTAHHPDFLNLAGARRLAGASLVLLSVACRPPSSPAPPPLPAIPVYEISSPSDTAPPLWSPAPQRDPFDKVSREARVTIATSNADVRTLLLWLAQQGGVDLVVSQDVRARVSVNFRDVPVADAMRAVLAEAGLSVIVGSGLRPWPAVVFYQLPVNIETASAELIAARFGVSMELARWIVESRIKR